MIDDDPDPDLAPKLAVEWVPIERVHESPSNPRDNDSAVPHVAASLRRFGWQQPIVAKPCGEVIAGNTRLKAAHHLEFVEIPVVWFAGSDLDATAFQIADNRTSEFASWNDQALASLMGALRAEDGLEGVGYSDAEAQALIDAGQEAPEVVEDEAPEVQSEAVTRSGDLWLLGEHRVLCGDSTEEGDVAQVMGGEKAGLMVTDPPYGVGYDGGAGNESKRERLAGDESADLYAPALGLAASYLTDGAIYIWFAGRNAGPVWQAIVDSGYEPRTMIVWHKLNAHYGAFMAHYLQKHEPCFYAVRGAAGFVGASNEKSVWDIEQPAKNEHHPTQKPVECMARAIRNHDTQSVLDPFLGSGTTLIAAEQLGRRCFGLELEPRYVDVIVRRWEAATGKQATLEGSGQTFAEVAEDRGVSVDAA